MSIPDTAGRILSESEVRAYLKCSEFYKFGGLFEESLKQRLIRYTIEKITAWSLRKKHNDPTRIIVKSLNECLRKQPEYTAFLEPQLDQVRREALFGVNDILKMFPLRKYIPVTGPLPVRVRLSKTVLDLNVSGVFRSKKRKTLHVITFAPYSSSHALSWDIPTHLKIQYFKEFVPVHHQRKIRATAHIFGCTDGSKVHHATLDDRNVNKALLIRANKLIENMERGYHMPLVPCPYQCAFKKQCRPEE